MNLLSNYQLQPATLEIGMQYDKMMVIRVIPNDTINLNKFPHVINVTSMNAKQSNAATEWCKERIGIEDVDWAWRSSLHWHFLNEEDAVMFQLAWAYA